MICPNCKVEMTPMALEAHLKAPIAIDVCTDCQAFWFDKYEEIGLTPASVLQMMKLIGDHPVPRKAALSDSLQCPRCSTRLNLTHDMQHSTRFTYWRCDTHGRFIGFPDFLREKNFIRPLTPEEMEELGQKIQAVHCSSCGGAVDLKAGSVCPHCGSPLSILDMGQFKETLAQLQKAAQVGPNDPDLSKLKGVNNEPLG
jgi:Zn-finger nucleic acid-binding protein